MISITINADSAQQLQSILAMLAGVKRDIDVATGVADVLEAPEKPKRSSKKTTEQAPFSSSAKTAERNTGQSELTSEEISKSSATSAATSPSDSPLEAAPSEDSLRKRATQYAAKAGPTALIEMQKAAGAPNGKMSEIVTDPDMMKKLDILLADTGY